MRKFGLIGFPLGHSFSKQYFEEKFSNQHINDAYYNMYPMEDINHLPDLIASEPQLQGLNVTIPHKKTAINYCNELSVEAQAVGAVNCLKIKDGVLKGYNTDVIGFERSFSPLLESGHNAALILGSGGGSKAVQYVLNKLGIPFKLVSRSMQPNVLKYEDLDESILASHNILINTTPLGMFPNDNDKPELPYQFINPTHLLYDLIYNPQETKFLIEGKLRGASVKNGLEMLTIQAEESWNIWN